MCLVTAIGEVSASKCLKVPLRSFMSADALVMNGCLDNLSLGSKCREQAGLKTVLKSPDGKAFKLGSENCTPIVQCQRQRGKHGAQS